MSDYSPHSKYESINPKLCRAGVWDGYRPYQCAKPPTRDGYCGIHHPDAQKKRDEKRNAIWKTRRAGLELADAIEKAERKVIATALETVPTVAVNLTADEMKPLARAVQLLRELLAKAAP